MNWDSLWISISFVLILLFIVAGLILFLLAPIIVANSHSLLLKTIFTNDSGTPTDKSFYEKKAKKSNIRNLYVTYKNQQKRDVTLGVYHVLPLSYTKDHVSAIPDKKFEDLLWQSPYPVLLVFHGRGQTRAYFENKYKLLSNFFHVLIFDYRCYADSSQLEITEPALIEDCINLFKWLLRRTTSDIYVWGHSLGSALCVETVYFLNKENVVPKGMVLESGFTKLEDAIIDSPIGRIFSWLPWFTVLLNSYKRHGFIFNTIEQLSEIKCPVMIIHAADDKNIPFKQSAQLYQVAVRRKIQTNLLKFLPVDKIYRCGHCFIYNFPKLSDHILDFLKTCETEFNPKMEKGKAHQ